MKILIYGAGVIGSTYAVRLAKAGYSVFVYARGQRLQALENKGLLYQEGNQIKKAPVTILATVSPLEMFDFIFVTVRYEQVEAALTELATNQSPNIVTMVNNPHGYAKWEDILGQGKLIPAFPGAGGTIAEDILYSQLTPRIIQPTTFAEIDGRQTERIKALAAVFKTSKIPYSISKNMDAWQKSHLAMVLALANGIYVDGGNNYTTAKNKAAIRFVSSALRENFNALRKIGVPIVPAKLNIFWLSPLWVMNLALRLFYNAKFAETFADGHVQAARGEMELLDQEFKELLEAKGASIDIAEYNVVTSMMLALQCRNFTIVQFLFIKYENVFAVDAN